MALTLKRINDKVAFEVTNSTGQSIRFDANPEVGGEGLGLRPMEALASSVAACASIDILLILKKKRITLENYEVELVTERKDATPAPFTNIHLVFTIGKNDPIEQVQKAVALGVEKYCSVSASLDPTIAITHEVKTLN
jgi:putative redox protein